MKVSPPPAGQESENIRLKLETMSFGNLEYEEQAVIQLLEGMLGFPKLKKYILVEEPESQPFKWLQSVEDPYVAFAVVDPHTLFKGYRCAIELDDVRTLEISDQAEVTTLAVVVLAEDPAHSTINLKAPVLINHKKMRGKQVVLQEPSYGTQQAILGDAKR
jgi:flagellar assembly factor FliW